MFEEKDRKVLKADVNPKTGKRRVKVAGEETVVQPCLQVRHCGPRVGLTLLLLVHIGA